MQFWHDKIRRNQYVDSRTYRRLQESGWRVLEIWECALKGKTRLPAEKVIATVALWLTGVAPIGALTGTVAADL